MRSGEGSRLFLSALGVGAVLLLWQLGAALVGAELILPTPGQTLSELLLIVSTERFVEELLATVARGLLALLLILLGALPLGLLSGHYPAAESVLTVPVAIIRSTPVISVILLALIWFPSGGVPIFVALLMGFPLLFENIAAGMRSVDRGYLEMSRTFCLSPSARLIHLYLPAIGGYLGSGLRATSGIVWKVVVAAEVLSQPGFGIGSRLQESRIFLETAAVFGWTALLILVSLLSDRLLKLFQGFRLTRIVAVRPGALRPAAGMRPGALRPAADVRPGAFRPAAGMRPGALRPGAGMRPDVRPGALRPAAGEGVEGVGIEGASKRYDETLVFSRLSVFFPPGSRSAILGPSGCGKTTLLRILAGIETLEAGEVLTRGLSLSYAFQEPRLLPWLTAEENLLLVREAGRGYRHDVRRILELLGLGEVSDSTPEMLSGGMRLRLGLARAVAVEPQLLLLDEPFSALDVESRRQVQRALAEQLLLPGQTVVAVTHDIHDACVLAERLYLFSPKPMELLEVMEVDPGGDPGEQAVEVYRRMVQAL